MNFIFKILIINFFIFITFSSYASFIGKYLICNFETYEKDGAPLLDKGFFFKNDDLVVEYTPSVKNDNVKIIINTRKLIQSNEDFIFWGDKYSKFKLNRSNLNLLRSSGSSGSAHINYKCKVIFFEDTFTKKIEEIKNSAQKNIDNEMSKNKI